MKKNGFTLLDLLWVLAVMAVIVSLTIFITGSIKKKTVGKVRAETLGYPDSLDNLEEGEVFLISEIAEVNGVRYAFLQKSYTLPTPRVYSLRKDTQIETGELYITEKEFILPPRTDGTCESRKTLVPFPRTNTNNIPR